MSISVFTWQDYATRKPLNCEFSHEDEWKKNILEDFRDIITGNVEQAKQKDSSASWFSILYYNSVIHKTYSPENIWLAVKRFYNKYIEKRKKENFTWQTWNLRGGVKLGNRDDEKNPINIITGWLVQQQNVDLNSFKNRKRPNSSVVNPYLISSSIPRSVL